MAYISKAFERNWTYDRSGSDFDARVGNLLNDGADLQASSVAAALAATQSLQEAAGLSSSGQAHSSVAEFHANPHQKLTSSKACVGPHPGYAWVDEHGQMLAVGPPASAALMKAAISTTGQQQQQKSHSATSSAVLDYSTMTATQRSMTIWKRISPGMLPDTSATPLATTAEAHKYEPALVEPTDFIHHLKKTEFSEYTECALKHMHHIKTAAKK